MRLRWTTPTSGYKISGHNSMIRLLFLTILTLCFSYADAKAREVKIAGFVSLGSNAGLIFDKKREFAYSGMTKNLSILAKGCPTSMGQLASCVANFEATGRTITRIISANAPPFGGISINRPGNVTDAYVCEQEANVDYEAKIGCQHFDELSIQILAIKAAVAKVKWNGNVRFTLSQRLTVNCDGTAVSLNSFIGKNFPPGMKKC